MSSEEEDIPERVLATHFQRGPFLSVVAKQLGMAQAVKIAVGFGAALSMMLEESSCAEHPLKQRYSNVLKVDTCG
jgi:hypothetical protein